MILADFGADVIKVETPATGDDTRTWGPIVNGYSAFYAYINRNKRGITLNLKTEEGKRIFLELVRKVDVVVENFRPGVMKRLGLDYQRLKEINPQLIYASASGFGTYGPYAMKPGYDVVAQAMGGLMSLTGPIDGEPYKAGAAVADVLTGLNLTVGILSALHYRQCTGKGQYFEVALVDSIISLVSVETYEYLYNGIKTRRIGNKNVMLSPYGTYKASDGDFVICCGNQKLFEQLCTRVLHRPELIEDQRFCDMPARAEHYDLLKQIIEEWTGTHTVEENVACLEREGIPTAPIMDIEQIYHDSHMRDAREMFIETEHPSLGKVVMTGTPYKLSESKAQFFHRAPYLGEHNEEVLHSMLGLNGEEICRLAREGVV